MIIKTNSSILSELITTGEPSHELIAEKQYGIGGTDNYGPIAVTILSALSTLAIFYFIFTSDYGLGEGKGFRRKKGWKHPGSGRTTVLPGYGIFGDKVNEVIEAFLDTLAIYVHNDQNWDCSRRMLCEANQRAYDYGGMGYGLLTYLLSFGVSFMLRGQKVSESMEAMRRGRHGLDCKSSYPKCPVSL